MDLKFEGYSLQISLTNTLATPSKLYLAVLCMPQSILSFQYKDLRNLININKGIFKSIHEGIYNGMEAFDL